MNLPNLSLRCIHCDMWGNCRIFFHFLLFPLLLSEPPETNNKKNVYVMHKFILDTSRNLIRDDISLKVGKTLQIKAKEP